MYNGWFYDKTSVVCSGLTCMRQHSNDLRLLTSAAV